MSATQWHTEPANRPVLSFGAITLSSGNVTFSVASVSQAFPYLNYKVTLQVGTETGPAALIAAETSYAAITVASTTYRVYWSDLGDEGNLNDGDAFRVTGNGVPLGPGIYTFYLLWSALYAQIQTKTWLL